MKRSLSLILPAVLAFNIQSAKALEIDEKLTLRFLRVSSTKKTVLINRGGEDGLVVGDHAKFYITAGVIARGIVEKVSPSRSVWSLYRIVDPAEIVDDKVLNLKIASPVKVTTDPTKSMQEEAIPGGNDVTVTSEDASEMGEVGASGSATATEDEKNELKEMGMEDSGEISDAAPVPAPKMPKGPSKKVAAKNTSVATDDIPVVGGVNRSKTWEIWGTIYINSLSGTVESGDESANTSTSATASTIDFSAGVEKYFVNTNSFAKELSVSLFAHKRTVESGDTIKSKADWFEYGVGANYHFYNSAASINKLIGFGTMTLGMGNAQLESKSTATGTEEADPAVKGSNSFFSIGVGAKYILSSGFGIRATLDYYTSSEKYDYEEFSDTRKLSGPRINFGLSYRF